MTAPELLSELAACLDAVEAEMKAIGFWIEDPPDTGSPMEVGLALWLQGVFLPHARQAVADDDLPERSQVGLMALREYDYMGTVEEALPLVRLLNEFDALILKAAPPARKRRKRTKPT